MLKIHAKKNAKVNLLYNLNPPAVVSMKTKQKILIPTWQNRDWSFAISTSKTN